MRRFTLREAVLSATVAVAVICKTPAPGKSKTRLSPPLLPEECAAISACFIRDLTATIAELQKEGRAVGYAVYTPVGSEAQLRELLPPGFGLIPQVAGDLGARLQVGIADLMAEGHRGAILINSDSPTMPLATLRAAVDAVAAGDSIVLSPSLDVGYTLVGLSAAHDQIFTDMPWSTPEVFPLTIARAKQHNIPVTLVPGWYDVDDAETLAILESEMRGEPVTVGGVAIKGADAPASRAFLSRRNSR
jgi:rSAM/selenodomain-associated transferase 1